MLLALQVLTKSAGQKEKRFLSHPEEDVTVCNKRHDNPSDSC